jgi:hypothetical protein
VGAGRAGGGRHVSCREREEVQAPGVRDSEALGRRETPRRACYVLIRSMTGKAPAVAYIGEVYHREEWPGDNSGDKIATTYLFPFTMLTTIFPGLFYLWCTCLHNHGYIPYILTLPFN